MTAPPLEETPSSLSLLRKWAPMSMGVLTLLFLVTLEGPDHRALLEGDYLVCSPNTFRDFEVYREIQEGLLPLEGPSTSIGGHHGYLAYWIFGAWSVLVPGFGGLQLFGVLVLGLSMWLSWLLARRVGASRWASLTALVYLASPIVYLIHYPNHIVLIPLATALAFYGLVRSKEHLAWALLASLGVVLAIGAHRTGWLLLLGVVVLDWRLHLGWLRKGMALLPLALYLVPEGVAFWNAGEASGPMDSPLTEMDPWLVLRTMPFHQFKEDAGSLLRWAELALVLAALVGAFVGTRENKEGRAVWWFYALNFAIYPFYRFDLQYYMPMFALLPTLMALALDVAWAKKGVEWVGPLALVGVLVAGGWALHLQAQKVQQPESKHFRSVASELAAVRALDSLGATQKDVLECTAFVAPPEKRFSFLYRPFTEAEEGSSESLKAFRVGPKADPMGPDVVRSKDAGEYRVEELKPGSPCASTLRPISEHILYWNLSTGELERR